MSGVASELGPKRKRVREKSKAPSDSGEDEGDSDDKTDTEESEATLVDPFESEGGSEESSCVGSEELNDLLDLEGPPPPLIPDDPPPLPPPIERKGDTAMVVLPSGGRIKLYVKNSNMVAECKNPGHVNCFLTRRITASPAANRRGQGRCVGKLAAWCEECPEGLNAHDHIRLFAPALRERCLWREAVKLMAANGDADAKLLLDPETGERRKRDGENSEPDEVP